MTEIRDMTMRGPDGERLTCRKGDHPWTPGNTFRQNNGELRCKPCYNRYCREYRRRRRGEK